jgi:hypothetical protein
MSATDEFLSSDELATFLKVGKHTPPKWRSRGEGPPWCKFGKTVRYPKDAALEWAKSCLRNSRVARWLPSTQTLTRRRGRDKRKRRPE